MDRSANGLNPCAAGRPENNRLGSRAACDRRMWIFFQNHGAGASATVAHVAATCLHTVASLCVRVSVVMTACTAGAFAQNVADAHYLTFQVGLVGEAVSRNENLRRVTKLSFDDRLSGRVQIRSSPSADGVTWSPLRDEVKIESRISEGLASETELMGEGGVRASETRNESYAGTPQFEANFVNASVTIRPEAKRYDIQFTLMADMATTQEAVRHTRSARTSGASSLGGGQPAKNSMEVVPLQMGPAQLGLPVNYDYLVVAVKDEALDPDYGFLSGSKRIPVPKPAGWSGSWSIAIDVTWQVDATRPPVELVVTADAYADWRPQGSIKEPSKPGNGLVARATLLPKGNLAVKDLPQVKAIRFALLDTSREPGVCLNWPLGAKDADYDLRLAAVTGGTLSKSDQALEVTDPKNNEAGQPYAEVKVESYDFGGRASLRAVCILADGREIEGVMRASGSDESPVRLPKMKSPGWIADTWRTSHDAAKLADDDDNEKVAGQKHNGDGFTLYEEYRGWAVNGKHVEGDPLRKDFFVLNRIGLNARPGIELFEQLSQLRVHSKLRLFEMSVKDRLMNGNRRDAPQRGKQHGVWVQTFSRTALGNGGANTVMTKAGVAGRPGITEGVGILARTNAESIFNQPFNLPAQDAIFAYDRAIAHELLHSVGVEHHGKGDSRLSAAWVSPRHPNNKIGRPYFRPMVFHTDGVLTLLDENGHDLAAQHMALYAQERVKTDNFFREGLTREAREYQASSPSDFGNDS